MVDDLSTAFILYVQDHSWCEHMRSLVPRAAIERATHIGLVSQEFGCIITYQWEYNVTVGTHDRSKVASSRNLKRIIITNSC